jgi:hypothetical protein
MKIHFMLIFLSILACLSGCSSSPTPSIEPDSQPSYWYKGIGFQEKEKNGVLVRSYAAGVDDNVICFYIIIFNKSDASVLTDKADFSLREIAGIPADGEKSLVVGNEEKAAESREFARKLVDQINTESLCQAVSCGLLCTSMFLPPSDNNSRTQENLRYDMDERQERINAKTRELEEKERQVSPKRPWARMKWRWEPCISCVPATGNWWRIRKKSNWNGIRRGKPMPPSILLLPMPESYSPPNPSLTLN